MTQEDKELLLRDLSARLNYGVKVWYKYKTWNSKKFATSIRLADEKIALSSKFNKEGDWFPIEEAGEILIKPYLRPMSSMTEEEEDEYSSFVLREYDGYLTDDMPNYTGKHYVYIDNINVLMDWLNAHHFDYRGLIPMGLALEAIEYTNL